MRSGGIRYVVVGLVVLIVAAYIVSIMMYAQGDAVRRLDGITPVVSADEPSATINVEEIQSNYSVLAVNLQANRYRHATEVSLTAKCGDATRWGSAASTSLLLTGLGLRRPRTTSNAYGRGDRGGQDRDHG